MLDAVLTQNPDRDETFRDLLLTWARDARSLATWMLRDADSGDDAVQEAALLGWRRRSALRDIGRAESWLNQILVNVCRQELRRRAKQVVTIPAVESVDGHDGRVAERDEIAAAMACLKPDEQIVVALRYGRDLSIPQIASQTGLREGTVKSRLHYALEHLKSALAAQHVRDEADR
jgi:RNA polymerase sigma-70 factor (ECF subfamily)